MNNIFVTILGFVAAACTTIAFLPQAIKVWETRCTTDISLATFLILTAGVIFWFIYGILRNDLPIIAANAITFILVSIILIFKFKYY